MRFVLALAVVAGAGAAGCTTPLQSTCASDADCGGLGNKCFPAPDSGQHYCAYPSSTCLNGYRWFPQAAEGLARTCVGGGDETGTIPGDAGTPDMLCAPFGSAPSKIGVANCGGSDCGAQFPYCCYASDFVHASCTPSPCGCSRVVACAGGADCPSSAPFCCAVSFGDVNDTVCMPQCDKPKCRFDGDCPPDRPKCTADDLNLDFYCHAH